MAAASSPNGECEIEAQEKALFFVKMLLSIVSTIYVLSNKCRKERTYSGKE
jgi:hypothetical protein